MLIFVSFFDDLILGFCYCNLTREASALELTSTVGLLGVQVDDKLNFSLHISYLCKSAANQLSALIKLNKFLCFEGKRVSINSYFMSNFNYCLLVWMFSNVTYLKKIENL